MNDNRLGSYLSKQTLRRENCFFFDKTIGHNTAFDHHTRMGQNTTQWPQKASYEYLGSQMTCSRGPVYV